MFLTFPEAFRPGGRAMPLPPCCCAAIPKHTGEDDEKTIQLLCLEYERLPPRIAAPAVKNCRDCNSSSLIPPVLHRPFWIRQASRAASAICSACKMGDAVHPPAGGKILPQQSAGQIQKGWLACLPMETLARQQECEEGQRTVSAKKRLAVAEKPNARFFQ